MAFDDGVKTVSGSVVSFSNGADDVPLKSCEVEIAPTLTGVSSVSVVRQGKNIYGLVPYQATGSNTPAFSDCMCIKAGQYVFSFGELSDGENTASNWRYSVTVYDTDGTLNETDSPNTSALPYRAALYSFASPVNSAQKSIILTFTKDCYIFIRFWSGDTTSSMEMTNPMLEVGSTATAYEPYVAPTTYTAQLGRTIYGGTADIVNGTGKETHAKMIFTGADAENWSFSSSGGNSRVFAQLTNAKTDTNTFASNLITPAPSASGYPAIGTGWINNNGRIVIGVDSSITSASDWKTYLSNNNMDIAYELADEYKTDFTFDGQEIPTRLGYNAFWSEHGNTELTYYKSGYGFTSVTVHKETPDGEPVVQTAKFHRIVYGGQADVVRGICEPKNLVDFLSNIEPTYSGFTITVTSDYGINFSGTGTRTWAHLTKTIPCDFDAGTKLVFSIQEDKDYNIYVLFTYEDSSTEQFTIAGIRIMDSVAFTLAKKAVSVRLDVALLQASTEYNETLYCMIEKGTTKTDFAPYFAPFTFQPISMETDEGENNLFAIQGDSAITYRKAVD